MKQDKQNFNPFVLSFAQKYYFLKTINFTEHSVMGSIKLKDFFRNGTKKEFVVEQAVLWLQ